MGRGTLLEIFRFHVERNAHSHTGAHIWSHSYPDEFPDTVYFRPSLVLSSTFSPCYLIMSYLQCFGLNSCHLSFPNTRYVFISFLPTWFHNTDNGCWILQIFKFLIVWLFPSFSSFLDRKVLIRTPNSGLCFSLIVTDYVSPPYKAIGTIIDLLVCWGMTSCSVIYRYRCFGRIRCLHTPQKHNTSFQKFCTLYVFSLVMNLFKKRNLQAFNVISILVYHSGPTFGQVLYCCQDAFVVDASDYSGHLTQCFWSVSHGVVSSILGTSQRLVGSCQDCTAGGEALAIHSFPKFPILHLRHEVAC